MGSLRTLFTALVAGLAALPAHADRAALLHDFATCAGRLSAEMEHQWLLSDPAADRTEAQREAFLDLIDAAAPPDGDPRLLAWRIEAKAAHAALLSRATFGDDAWAAETAARLTRGCTALLVS